VRRGRVVTSATAILALILGVGIAQSQPPAAAAAEALAAQTVADARAAALAIETDPAPTPDPDPTPSSTPDPTPAPTPVGAVTPGESSTVDAPDLGTTIDFSGHEISEPLDVTVAPLPQTVADSAAAETSALVLTAPFDVTATTDAGIEVTSFPADPTILDPDAVQPVVVDVTPGVAVSIAVSSEQLQGIDPTSVRIVTREHGGEPWLELPSFYDEELGAAVAQSDHLSQFAVIGTPFVPTGPRIVLDPDDDVGYTVGPNGYSTELPYNVRLANALAAQLQTLCQAKVFVTRTTTDQPYLSRDFRAAQAAAWAPDVTLTVAFNTVYGYAWGGDETEGGSLVWGRGSAADTALRNSLVATLPGYTSRPAHVGSDPRYPWSEFDSLPGAMVHLETLFFDNTDDRGVLDSPGGWEAVTSGVATGIGMYAESLGYDCTDPATGGWPAKPSAAQLAAWKQLGYHYHQVYGGDPVSFSTGNLLEDEPLFTLNGPGGQAVDLTLVYNSQDGRASRVGAGWSFGLGARAQRFDDGSVLVVGGDGASEVFSPDGAGGYTADPDVHDTLTESGLGRLTLTSVTGQTWVFDASDVDGIGELVSFADQQGNGYTLAYGDPATVTDPASDPFSADRFLPLASITDSAWQVIQVTTDSLGRVTGFTHPDGRTWSLGYNGAGDLTTITNPDGRVRTFSYDTAHRMLTATDAAGVTYLINEYDAQGRVTRQWDADGNVRTIEYTGTILTGGRTVYTDNEGAETTYEWDERSRITSITDALGGVESYTYDADGNVATHTDPAGNTTGYRYDADGNLQRETAPDGSVRTYTYTATGVPASMTDSGGPANTSRTTTYDVDARGLATAAHLPDGSTVTFAYTSSGDLASVTDQAGNTTSFGYDAVGNLVTVTDPLGQVTTTVYDAAGRAVSTTDPTGATTTFEWDAGDRLVASTDALGASTRYGYDANDHVVSVTDALGAVTRFAWDDLFHLTAVTTPDGAITRYGYDSEDRLTSITDPLGAVTRYDVDALGRQTQITDANGAVWLNAYDALGQLVEVTDPLGAVTRYAYDAMGRPTTVTDPTGAATTAAYDSVGRLVSTTDAAGGTLSYAYTILDQLAAATDQTGATTSYTYDIVGNQIATIDRRGQRWSTGYDAIGRVTSTTDPTGATSRVAYDSAAREVRETDPLGNMTVTSLDALGRAASVTDPLGAVTAAVYDAAGRLTATTDANGAVSTAAYDSVGRITALTDALGDVSRFSYDRAGRVVSTADSLGIVTAYSYDPLGRLTQVTDGFHPVPTTATGTDVNVTTRYAFTATGLLESITDANGAVTKFDHDSRGLTTAETNPLGIVVRTTYDVLGRPVSSTDGSGATTRTSYTARSDVAQIAYPDGVTVGFEYDAEQNPIVMTDALGATGWAYDRAGRMVSQTDPTGATLGWEYDAAGRLTSLAVPGASIGYGYDAAGRTTSQTSPWGSLTYAYDPVGNLLSEARSSGVTTTTSYDALGRVTAIRHETPVLPEVRNATSTVARWDGRLAVPGDLSECPAGAAGADSSQEVSSYLDQRAVPGTAIAGCEKTNDYASGRGLPTADEVFAAGDTIAYAYSYDRAGNVTSETESRGSYGSVTTGFAYDDLERLVGSSSTDGTSNAYSYDRVGNRTSWVSSAAPDTGEPLSVASVFNAAGQVTAQNRTRPEGTTQVSFRYDRAGNRTQQASSGPDDTSVVSYAYTAAGRLASTTQGASSTSYGYDGLGRALTMDAVTEYGTERTTAVYSGLSAVQQSSDLTGTVTLLRDAVGRVALQSAAPGDGSAAASWSLQDRLGSTVAQTTTAGRVTDLVSYSDFGVPTFASTGFASSVGFTGELTDATAGLNSYFARTYDPFAATWLTADSYRGSLTNPASQHRYGYVEGNPTTFTDHLGFSVLDDYEYGKRKAGPSAAAKSCTGRGCRPVPSADTPAGSSTTSSRHPAVCGARSQLPGCVPREQTQQQKDNTQNALAILAGIGIGIAIAAAIVGVAACTVVTLGVCGVATGALIGAAIAGGAAGSLVTYNLSTGAKTPEGYAKAGLTGGLFGAVGGLAAPALGPVLSSVGTRVTAAASGTASGARTATATLESASGTRAGGLLDDATLANQHVSDSGTTVLGAYPGYIQKAEARGASYFDLGSAWDEIAAVGRDPWDLNVQFLDDRIAAQDTILLSTPKTQIREGTYLYKEVDHLVQNGYVWVNQWSLRPGG